MSSPALPAQPPHPSQVVALVAPVEVMGSVVLVERSGPQDVQISPGQKRAGLVGDLNLGFYGYVGRDVQHPQHRFPG